MTTALSEGLLRVALDIGASLSSDDRSRRLVEVVHDALPGDAVALLQLEGDVLVPAAAAGLSLDVFGRRFARHEHPRLDIICASESPTRFPADSPLPDPFDGLVIGGEVLREGRVHSCLGCPLRVEGQLVGVLTADALAPAAFDPIEDRYLVHLAALAAAALRTNRLIDALQRRAEHLGVLARDLVHGEMQRHGAVLIGSSPAMVRVRRELELIARAELPVLVTGETGVGKELVVRSLHAASRRAEQPLVYLNCAALPETLAESELFGHVRGAFTGAERDRIGKFKLADQATLFLDEIGELSLGLQAKLLRALQQGEIQRIGADARERVDVRVIAATNRKLDAEVAAGRFRADLLHRLDVCRIEVPPLRERRADIPQLVGHFLERARIQLGTGVLRMSVDAQRQLAAADWPGNVRELENVVARAVLRASGRVARGDALRVELEDLDDRRAPSLSEAPPLPALPQRDAIAGTSLRDAVDEFQRERLRDALARCEGNWSAAARLLQVDRGNLHHLARRLGMK
jgi:anaerobic nitric oxide reductase transcription regulator